jgi:hypothetical protein
MNAAHLESTHSLGDEIMATRSQAGSNKKSGTSKKSAGRRKTIGRAASRTAKSTAKGQRRYGSKAQELVGQKMHDLKRGKLRSGSGRKVSSRKRAIAIGLSEARRKGGKVPQRKTAGRRGGSAR